MFRYRPSERVHVVDEANDHADGRTLCGIAHGGDVEDVGDTPDDVLPWHLPYCQRCRAAYFKLVRDALDVDVTSLQAGDVIEYWVRDPTDPSESMAQRKTGEIVKVPPWTRTYDDEEYTIEGKYKVYFGGNTYSTASFKRIWRVNEDDLELSGGVFG